ncbi:hypothetical protein ABCR94_25040 [Streptomyces sp. 21So2-11]|uniref:hypothetical protein n=1 Tax=Streptomyces sp. 21So2-11 TaxID=3144408 RepID=UPI00321915B0
MQAHGGAGTRLAPSSALEVTMRELPCTVKADPEDDDGQGGNDNGGCGDGGGCGRK